MLPFGHSQGPDYCPKQIGKRTGRLSVLSPHPMNEPKPGGLVGGKLMEPEQVVEMVVVETEVDDSGVARTYTASIFVDENGVGSPLMCQYHNSDSCADVINTMKKGNDAPHLWNRGFWHSRDFIIPVMPSEGIKMMVSTTDEWAEEGDSKTLLWKSPGHEDVEMSFLGFLSLGDGRMAIREMILNEMDLLLGFVEKCTHPRHN